MCRQIRVCSLVTLSAWRLSRRPPGVLRRCGTLEGPAQSSAKQAPFWREDTEFPVSPHYSSTSLSRLSVAYSPTASPSSRVRCISRWPVEFLCVSCLLSVPEYLSLPACSPRWRWPILLPLRYERASTSSSRLAPPRSLARAPTHRLRHATHCLTTSLLQLPHRLLCITEL